jgi:prefoldin subunit 5
MGAEFAVRNAAELIKVSARRREIDDELEQLRARLESIQRRIEPIDRIRNDSYRGREIIKQEMRDLGCSRPPQLY